MKIEKIRLSFDNLSYFIDSDYVDFLGILKVVYDDFLKYVDGRVKSILLRIVRISLVIFFMKLRGGDFNKVFFILFNILKFGIWRSIKVICFVFIDGNFVKENFGF